MKIGVISLGCDKNTVDTERYLAQLADYGAEATPDLGDADLILVNTCGFIDAAKRDSIDAMVEAGRLKAAGSCQAVIAVGCLVERYREDLARALPEVDVFLGTSDADQLAPILSQRGWLPAAPVLVHPGNRIYAGDLPHVRYLKVSEGCDHGCAFCAIPLMRGRHRSFALEDVIREAQLLEMQGAREINLVAQDLAHYGRDRRQGDGLAQLLEALVSETSVPWIRLLYVYSAGLSDRVVSVLAGEPRIVKYLDMPIQHGSDAVLERMRRPERRATIKKTVARIREAVPGIALRTTCIVGFPGETEDDVTQLMDLLEEVQFERVGMFAYSEQPGTRAAMLADDVPEPQKRERLERVSDRQRLITGERYEGRVGTKAQAIVDRPAGPAQFEGEAADHWRPDGEAGTSGVVGRARLSWQADDIDGITYVDRDDLQPGTIVDVHVDEVVDDYDFRVSVERVTSHAAPPSSERPVRRSLPMAPGSPGAVGSFGR